MANTVVYDDEHIVCIFQPGNRADALIVTFGEMMMRPSPNNDIWAGRPIRNLDFSAIGFVAKSRNWFPESSVLKAIDLIKDRIRAYPKIIGYGFSMGGWAVLYYARQLELTACIAFSPQFSIDPADVDDPRFSVHYDPRLNAGMAIGEQSGSSLNIVVCDPHDAGDLESATKISKQIETIQVRLPYVGHGSVRCITRTAILGNILSATLSGEESSIERTIRESRRNAPSRAFNISHKLVGRKPRLAFSIYSRHKDNFHIAHRPAFFYKLRNTRYRRKCFREMAELYEAQRDAHSYLSVLALFLNDMGRKAEAKSCIERAIGLHDRPSYHFIAEKIRG